MADQIKDKVLGVYQKIQAQIDQKQDKLTQQQLSSINLVSGYETRIANIESQLSGLEQALHTINTGSNGL